MCVCVCVRVCVCLNVGVIFEDIQKPEGKRPENENPLSSVCVSVSRCSAGIELFETTLISAVIGHGL